MKTHILILIKDLQYKLALLKKVEPSHPDFPFVKGQITEIRLIMGLNKQISLDDEAIEKLAEKYNQYGMSPYTAVTKALKDLLK